jgi:hypothetical protein
MSDLWIIDLRWPLDSVLAQQSTDAVNCLRIRLFPQKRTEDMQSFWKKVTSAAPNVTSIELFLTNDEDHRGDERVHDFRGLSLLPEAYKSQLQNIEFCSNHSNNQVLRKDDFVTALLSLEALESFLAEEEIFSVKDGFF